MIPSRIARLAGYGAFGATLLFVAIYALIAIAAVPRRTGGIDWTQAAVTWISVGLAVLALIAVHIVVARQLLALARGARESI
jgi:hypothetical protein